MFHDMKDYLLTLIPNKTHKCLKTAELICERCGNKFTVPFWMVKKGRRFCSHACRKQDPLKTLLSRVDKQENGCWNYTRCVHPLGYGQIKVGKTMHNAHRLMWILWNRKRVPDGMVVRHTCIGNRRCINPDHLIIGTQKDNVHDCIQQGRFKPFGKGVERSNAKLTDDIVRQIRVERNPTDGSKPTSFRVLSERFEVSYAAVWFAANKMQWKHVA